MSRPLRIEFPGAVYHVTARSAGGETIFTVDAERSHFLDLLGREIGQHRWLCYGFCLLDSEYRLVVETPEGDLGRGIGRLNAIYSQWFNRRHHRNGHLFRGRYKAVVLEKDVWLAPVLRDLALAPVRAGLTEKPGRWPWSSHRSIGKGRGTPDWLSVDAVLAEFADAAQSPRKSYRQFVNEGGQSPRPWEQVRAQLYLGSNAWLERMTRAQGKPEAAGLSPARSERPSRETIIGAVARCAGVPAAATLDRHVRQDVFQVTVYLLRRAADLSLKEVADLARVSPPRISQIQRAIEDAGGLSRAFRWAQPLAVYLASGVYPMQ